MEIAVDLELQRKTGATLCHWLGIGGPFWTMVLEMSSREDAKARGSSCTSGGGTSDGSSYGGGSYCGLQRTFSTMTSSAQTDGAQSKTKVCEKWGIFKTARESADWKEKPLKTDGRTPLVAMSLGAQTCQHTCSWRRKE
eukprot:1155757-Pelagomonas_calceolata.AAC.2